MGGGFMFTGNSTSFAAARPPFSGGAGNTRSFHTHNSLAAICSENNKSFSQNVGDSMLGSVPSRIEVERAIIDLQRFMNGLSSTPKSELDELQGLLYHHKESKLLQTPAGYVKFYNAFSMMQTEPALQVAFFVLLRSTDKIVVRVFRMLFDLREDITFLVQNMVVSISSDKAVWEAILSNKAVQDIQGSISARFSSLKSKDRTEGKVMVLLMLSDFYGKEEKLKSYNEEPDISILILKWIMEFTRSKILELVDKFGLLVNEILKPAPKEKPTSELTDLLEEKVRSSLLLSVVIIFIVVVTRNHG
ncbi:hypothetical protein BUALT_Bualt19G0020300 [Buddleja alternifolia]|uniref:Uncharacterized protein n=1 Tax=Buddleja alternifolia TaxID=168488 RepID=A0AAV6W0V6_9LAMI|nr:hypothetical protein BUALT_Bualt19G0020300 [Buddleja alternifolia]